jgi:hypothetical protein
MLNTAFGSIKALFYIYNLIGLIAKKKRQDVHLEIGMDSKGYHFYQSIIVTLREMLRSCQELTKILNGNML